MSGVTRPDQRQPPGDAVDRVVLTVGSAVAVVVLGVWLTGQVGAWLESGRWPKLSPATGLVVAIRLAGTAADPGRAWPPSVARLLPAPAGLYGVGAGVAVIFVLTVLVARRFSRSGPWPAPARGAVGGPSPRPGRRRAGASWARTRDLRALVVRRPGGGRLVLGRSGRRLVATEARHSVLIFGPTQSGKTTGLAVPAILEWDGPVVATSVKGDLAATTLPWRAAQGRCAVFDPTGTTDLGHAAGWTPIAEAADWSRAQRVAAWMVDATPARSGLQDGGFWYAAAAKQLAPLLLAARCGGLGMDAVVGWTNGDEWDEPAELLESAGQTEAAVALAAGSGRDERIRSSITTTLETVLAPFEDPAVRRAISGPDIDPYRLLAGCETLYLCGASYEQHRLQGLFAALVSAVVAAAVDTATRSGRALDPPLLVVLDEAANIAPIRDLDSLASTGAALGIQLVTVCQDLAQFTTRYGPERARTIANNHRAKLALSGVADLTTLDLLSGLAGEAAVREQAVTDDLRDGRRTRSTSTVFRRLAPADEIRTIPPGTGLLVYGHLPPARLRLRPWYADRQLRRRVRGRRDPRPEGGGRPVHGAGQAFAAPDSGR